jgi:hypothetical protein
MNMPEAGRITHAWPGEVGLIAINPAAIIFGTAALYGKLDISPFWIVMKGANANLSQGRGAPHNPVLNLC